ncbi:hypothetical protein [Novosphingobium album (ex Liu et al. 2023)]|uniref:Cupin domain-containing protein n=1 Tax=Novosphingobium album (ex Liu et al. 2023) TaxID=3031130 RepID=A0ABT5WX20_9SPHN|nr:hypothetical protein [Novosphingobium album (ex Liu et al. 2023)]MDE8654447.1 hypothetical protein [Novosphingobium album (ex Liu et al. 2023)]
MTETIDLAIFAASAPLNGAIPPIARINDLEAYVWRFSELPRWEVNPQSDKLLLVIGGTMRIKIQSADGLDVHMVGPGQMIRIPRDHWHSPEPLGEVSTLTIANYEGTKTADAPDRANPKDEPTDQ